MSVAHIDQSHDPDLVSWVNSAQGHPDFPVQNLPFGIFSPQSGMPRPGVAIGDKILDLQAVARLLPDAAAETSSHTTLNMLMGLAAADRLALRHRLSTLLTDTAQRSAVEPALFDRADCTLHLPAAIGDYTDFYVGIHHATNIGKLFRPDNPLLPNYKFVPIGYHGRASSVRPSGQPIIRPIGQRKLPDSDTPVFGPSVRLDYELELGIWIGRGNMLGEPIGIEAASEHLAGLCLLNDWSARDLQAWEYQPLGPFLSKNFHTTISPWIITTEALAPFRMAQPPRSDGDPKPLEYLADDADQARGAFAIEFEVNLATEQMRRSGLPPVRLSLGDATGMYWTVAQIITHHASNGCNLNVGDLLGTGTISGATRESFGSLMEITNGGESPLSLPTGETRTFLEDGDELSMRATARANGFVPIGFGECTAIVLPART